MAASSVLLYRRGYHGRIAVSKNALDNRIDYVRSSALLRTPQRPRPASRWYLRHGVCRPRLAWRRSGRLFLHWPRAIVPHDPSRRRRPRLTQAAPPSPALGHTLRFCLYIGRQDVNVTERGDDIAVQHFVAQQGRDEYGGQTW